MVTGRSYAAFLFDMDGTVLDSIAVTERIWGAWAERQGLDVAAFLRTIHGMRAADTIRRLALPGLDPEREALEILRREVADVDGIVPIPGAPAFLGALPPERWAIVTSAPRELARRRMAAAGLPLPEVLVTGEDVSQGKPAPDGYRLAAARLGVEAEACLVFEDAAAGIRAGEAAGAAVMVVTATHGHPLETPHATLARYDAYETMVRGEGLLLLGRSGRG